jgi:hypothetical protein
MTTWCACAALTTTEDGSNGGCAEYVDCVSRWVNGDPEAGIEAGAQDAGMAACMSGMSADAVAAGDAFINMCLNTTCAAQCQ